MSASRTVGRWLAVIATVVSLVVAVPLLSAPPAAAATSYHDVVLGNGPIFYMPFDSYSNGNFTPNVAPNGLPGGGFIQGSPFAINEPGAILTAPSSYSIKLTGAYVGTGGGTDPWQTSPASFEVWLKTAAGATGAEQTVFFDQSARNGGWVKIAVDASGNLVGAVNTAVDSYNLGDRQTLAVTGGNVADGQWHHVVMVVQESGGASVTVYADGAPLPAATSSRHAVWLVGDRSSTSANLGNYFGQFQGWLDEFAVYPYALSLGQARADYAASGRTPPALPLVGGPLGAREPGSRSNNVNAVSCGDPVSLPFGTFSRTWDDFTIPGRGDALGLHHTYSTNYASVDGPLGFGWDFSYDAHLSVDGTTQAATIREGCSTEVTFNSQPNGYQPAAPRTLAALVHNGDGTWTFVRKGVDTLTFNATGQLTQQTDRNGYHTNLAYDGSGHLATVTDPAGRALTFTWTGSHVATVTDPSSPARTISFGYNGAGELSDYTDVAGGNWHYTYDGAHRLLTMRDPRQTNSGLVVTNGYDGQGRVVSQSDQLNRTTTFDYTTVAGAVLVTDPQNHQTLNSFSTDNTLASVTRGYGTPAAATTTYTYEPQTAQVATVTDPNGHTSSFVYDSAGNQVRASDALGRPDLTARYNTFDEPVTVTDRAGVITTNVYDGNGNLTSTSTPLDGSHTRTTTFSYGDTGHPGDVTTMTDPDGKNWTFHYDANGDRDTMTDPLGDKTTTSFNAVGWPTSTVSPRGYAAGGVAAQHTTTFDSYTAFGDLKQSTDPLGHVTKKDYDANRNLISSTDGNQQTTTSVYDAANQQTEIHRPDGSVLKSDYLADGTLKSQTDGAGHATTYTYDPLARLASMTDPLGNTTSDGYDGAGNQTTKQDPGGNCSATPKVACTTMGYDADNELTSIAYSDGTTPNVSGIGYDNNGRRTSMTDPTGTSTWTYDALGRLTASATPLGGTVAYGYDLNGHVITIAYPNNAGTVTRTYDDAGRLHTVTDWLNHISTFNPDPDSNPGTDTLGNGTTTTWTVDNSDRVMGVSHASGANTIASFTYGRDNNNQLTQTTTTGAPADNHSYGYNQLEQLTQVDSPATSYSYDSADNLTRQPDFTFQHFNQADELTSRGHIIYVDGSGTTDLGTGTTLTAPLPATTQANDQVLVAVVTNNQGSGPTSVVSGSNGYTYAGTWRWGNGGPQLDLYRHTALAGDTSVTVTYPVGGNVNAKAVQVAVYRGVDTANPFDGSPSYCTGSGTICNPTLTPADYGEQEVALEGAGTIAPQTWTADAPLTQRAPQNANALVAAGVADMPVTTTTPNATLTTRVSGNSEGLNVALLLRPATTSYTYDARGNRTSTTAPSQTTTYGYDQANRLITATVNGTTTSYGYRGDGLRVSKTTGSAATAFAWDESGGLPLMLTEATGSAQSNFIYGPGGRILEQVAAQPPITAVAQGSAYDNGLQSSPLQANLDHPAARTDYIVAAVTVPSSVATTGPSGSGWTGLLYLPANGAYIVVYGKVAAGGETNVQFPFTNGTGSAKSLVVTVYRGVDPNQPYETGPPASSAPSNPIGSESVTTPATTTTAAHDLLVLIGGGAGSAPAAGTWTAPTGFSQHATATGALNSSTMFDKPLPVAGSTGQETLTYSAPLMNLFGVLVALKQAPPPTAYYHLDQLGSVRALTEQNGSTDATYTYDPYGNLTGTTTAPGDPFTNNFGYAGQYTDPETGLQYLRARYYDPSTGQFLTRDPAVLTTRDAYGYAPRSPLNYTDPSGLDSYNFRFNLGRAATPHEFESFAHAWCGELFPLSGCVDEFRVGQRLDLSVSVVFFTQSFPVEVIALTPTSFSFLSLAGHPEGAGRTITFSFCQDSSQNTNMEVSTSSDGSINTSLPGLKSINFALAEYTWQQFADNIRGAYDFYLEFLGHKPAEPI